MGIIICEFIFSSYCTQNKTNSQSCHLPSLQCCFQLFGNVAHISVSWFWTSSWSGFKSGSKVTFSFLLQSEPMLGINKGIDKSINNLPTSSHIFRKPVSEHGRKHQKNQQYPYGSGVKCNHLPRLEFSFM
jgi:hypothetical protein